MTRVVTPFYAAKAFSHINKWPMKSWPLWEMFSPERQDQLVEIMQIMADNCQLLAEEIRDDNLYKLDFKQQLQEARVDFLIAAKNFVREEI